MKTFIPIVVRGSSTCEWFTPRIYTDAARSVLGTIDLDPASCKLANIGVKAAKFYDLEINGLKKSWYGRIWLNPPYGLINGSRRSETKRWVNKLIVEYQKGNVKEAILLTHANLNKAWFQPLWSFVICFPSRPTKFWNKEGVHQHCPHPQAIIYFGINEKKFIEVFSEFGPVVRRIKNCWTESEL